SRKSTGWTSSAPICLRICSPATLMACSLGAYWAKSRRSCGCPQLASSSTSLKPLLQSTQTRP
ncbi:hypothetical protein GGI19_007188, partial [Coemansia pectinata]